MAQGGARPGAGRKKGGKNRATAEAMEQAKATGEMPLDYMLRVMRDDEADKDRRDRMAAAAAQYLHSKPFPSAPPGDDDGTMIVGILGWRPSASAKS